MNSFKRKAGMLGAFMLMFLLVVRPVPAFAMTNEELSEILNGATDSNDAGESIFGEVTEKVGDIGTSAKKLAIAAGSVVLVISLIITAVQFTNKSAAAADEAKKRIVMIVIAAILAISSVTLISMAGRIGDSISENVQNEHTNGGSPW